MSRTLSTPPGGSTAPSTWTRGPSGRRRRPARRDGRRRRVRRLRGRGPARSPRTAAGSRSAPWSRDPAGLPAPHRLGRVERARRRRPRALRHRPGRDGTRGRGQATCGSSAGTANASTSTATATTGASRSPPTAGATEPVQVATSTWGVRDARTCPRGRVAAAVPPSTSSSRSSARPRCPASGAPLSPDGNCVLTTRSRTAGPRRTTARRRPPRPAGSTTAGRRRCDLHRRGTHRLGGRQHDGVRWRVPGRRCAYIDSSTRTSRAVPTRQPGAGVHPAWWA